MTANSTHTMDLDSRAASNNFFLSPEVKMFTKPTVRSNEVIKCMKIWNFFSTNTRHYEYDECIVLFLCWTFSFILRLFFSLVLFRKMHIRECVQRVCARARCVWIILRRIDGTHKIVCVAGGTLWKNVKNAVCNVSMCVSLCFLIILLLIEATCRRRFDSISSLIWVDCSKQTKNIHRLTCNWRDVYLLFICSESVAGGGKTHRSKNKWQFFIMYA